MNALRIVCGRSDGVYCSARTCTLPTERYRGNPVQGCKCGRRQGRMWQDVAQTSCSIIIQHVAVVKTAPGILSHPTGQTEDETGKSKEAGVI